MASVTGSAVLRKSRLTLRARIVVAFGISGLLIGLMFAFGVRLAYESVENDLLVDMLERELGSAAGPNAPDSMLRVEHVRSTDPEWQALAAPVRALPPGFHELVLDESQTHVLVEARNGVRHVVIFRDANIERREHMLTMVLAVGVLLATYLSIWLGFITSQRVIEPVRELAAEVKGLSLSGTGAVQLANYADDEVGDLADAFHSYQQQLQGFLEREKSFTGTISHELRTPLTVIGNHVDVLIAGNLPDSQRDRLLRVRRAVNEAADLVNTFLAMARSQDRLQGECYPRAVIEALARSSSDQFGVTPEVELASGAPEQLPVPASLLMVILRNLLNNAIEHGRPPVRVQLTADRLRVTDAGGEPAAGAGGERLGLGIVRRLCERQGWQLSLEQDDAGTAASIHFGDT